MCDDGQRVIQKMKLFFGQEDSLDLYSLDLLIDSLDLDSLEDSMICVYVCI